jgi:hypothetical protein
MSDALDRLLAERRQREMESRQIYGEIYRDLTGIEGTLEVSVGEMPFGKPFFTFQTTAEWIGANVKLVGEMEMFNEDENEYRRIGDDYGNIEITSENIDLIRQRPVDFSRAIGIAKYLLMHPYHNLPDLVLVVSAPWVDKRDAPQWQDGRATIDSCNIEEISELTDKVLLRLGRMGDNDRYSIYALDGQHRLIGIKAALDMLETGVLHPRKKDGTPATGRNNDEHLEDWLDEVEDLGITKKDVMKFRTERVGIKLVPAVCKGETWEEAVQRVASIFKAFNTTSVAVPKGAATAMDQEDGFAVTARRTYKEAGFLKDLKTQRPTRLSPTNNTIAAKSTVLTTLATMKKMAEVYLTSQAYGEWHRPAKKNMMGQPPSEALVSKAVEEFVALWDAISTLPSMRSIEPWDLLPEEVKQVTPFREARNVAEMRRFPIDGQEGEAHMLFRPLGQQALAQAVGVVLNDPIRPMALDEIFELLGRYDAAGGFCMVKKSNPWWGVLYDQAREKIVTNGAKLAADLLEYMLTGDSSRGVEPLRLAFASARKSSSEGLYVDLNGNDVPLERFNLPARLH